MILCVLSLLIDIGILGCKLVSKFFREIETTEQEAS